MGQAVVDLPDPLDSTNSSDSISADDLLAKLAGDEIDRLLADSDNGDAQPEPTPTLAAEVTRQNFAPVIEKPATAAPAVNLDDVLNTAGVARSKPSEPPEAGKLQSSPINLAGTAQRQRPSLLLKPLVWMSAPLDPWPDQLRDILGKIGVMTLINALAVIAYVLLFRRHH